MTGGPGPLLSAAVDARRAGDDYKAARLLRASIVEAPNKFLGYIDLLGLSTFGDPAVSWSYGFRFARLLVSGNAVAWKNLAVAALGAGRIGRAHVWFHRALVLDPGRGSIIGPFSKGPTAPRGSLRWAHAAEPSAANRLRLVTSELIDGDVHFARQILEDAGRPDPAGPVDAVLLWAKALSRTGEVQRAIELLDSASRFSPLATWVHYDLAMLHRHAGWSDHVACSAKRAIIVSPAFDLGYALLGRAQMEVGAHENAVRSFMRTTHIVHLPDRSYLENLAAAHVQLRDVEPAITILRPLILQDPANLNTLSNYSVACHYAGDLQFAERYTGWCLVIRPDFADAYCNQGLVARMRGDVVTAKAAFDRSIELSGGRSFDIYTRGVFHLAEGDPVQGALDYNARWEIRGFSTSRNLYPEPSLPLPLWDGGVQRGSVLALWGEQGVGDEIWFSGFIEAIRDRVGEIRLEVTPHLVSLLRRSFPAITVLARGDKGTETAMRSADLQCPIGNLLMILAAERAEPGYLSVDQKRASRLRERYRAAGDGRRLVGVSWRSVKPGRGTRSFEAPLDAWGAVFGLPDTTFVSLQYGDVTKDQRLVRDRFGVDLLVDSEIDGKADLDGFAAQMAAMDAVVSVANASVSVAHGLNKPIYVALQLLQEDWRYSRSRDPSRWMPTARQAWQTRKGEWAPVLDAQAARLAGEVGVADTG